MSIAFKQQLLTDLEGVLADKLTVVSMEAFRKQAGEILESYDVTAITSDAQTSDEYLKVFLDAKTIEGKSDKTVERYRYVLKRLLDSVQASVPQITANHLRGYLMDEKNRGISDSTLDGVRSVFSSFFGWLWKEGMLDKNPCANIAPIKETKKIRLPFSDVELEKLKEACKTMRDRAMIEFLRSTGCRISEVCRLDRTDIDFENMECTVLGKGKKERTVYLDDVAAMILRRYLKERNDLLSALFIGKGTERITPQGARRALKMIEKASGVENVHPHRFRRTLATNLINRGMPIQEVAAILGHDKIDTTMRYVYIKKENVKNSYKKYA